MLTLKETLYKAEKDGVAIGHFNAPNIEIITAIINTALHLNTPVIIGFSEGERDFFRCKQAVDYVHSVRKETGHPIFVNADHTYSFHRVKEAIDAGFDSVIWDGAAKSYEENKATALSAVAYARESGREVLIEAELGFIGSGSSIIETPPEGAVITREHMTQPDEAQRFVNETGIDLLAPAVGNLHGVLKGGSNPHIETDLVHAIREAVGVPLVLHGGSGISNDDFKKGIRAGLAQIHVSTELRIAYHEALKKSLEAYPDQLAPYKLMAPVRDAVAEVVEAKIRLFNSGNSQK
jgi:fructose-bisphosphate aldolase class II